MQYIHSNLTERGAKEIVKKLTDEEVRKSFKIWLTNYSGKEDETALGPFLHDRIKAFVPHQQGWLKKARKGLFLSAETVAEKLKVSRAAY